MELPADINSKSLKLLQSRVNELAPAVDRQEVAGASVLRFDAAADRETQVEAGLLLAQLCLGGLGRVIYQPADAATSDPSNRLPHDMIQVETNFPVVGCMGCQYAGWPLATEGFFAMTSGPVRLLRGKEEVLKEYGLTQRDQVAIAILETAQSPDSATIQHMADQCRIPSDRLTVCLAKTSSLAGRIQIVARSVETAIHKLHEIGFDLRLIRSGVGVAPIPPDTDDDLTALGWTNDSMLYGADVRLQIDANDQDLEQWVHQVPSCSSPEFGKPFIELFNQYDRDFYRIDPLLFSPAKVTLADTAGRSHVSGSIRQDILQHSFGLS